MPIVARASFLRRMTVTSVLPTAIRGGLAGRPGPVVAEHPGVFLAGDWVGPVGMLADASLASAVTAGRLGDRTARGNERSRSSRSATGSGASRTACSRSAADADDAVQDAWLRWQGADHDTIVNPAAWLTTVTSRLALDRLREPPSATGELRRSRGCPSPLLTEHATDPTESAESLTVGFLTMLERLEPTERVVLLLADVFGEPFRAIADVTGEVGGGCRQIASRARTRCATEHRHSRRPVDAEERTRLVDAFTRATVARRSRRPRRAAGPRRQRSSATVAPISTWRGVPSSGSSRVSRFLVGSPDVWAAARPSSRCG